MRCFAYEILCVQHCSNPLNCDSSSPLSPQINSHLLTVNVERVLSDHFPISCFVVLQNIDAMLVLEACGSLVLYTGVTRVRRPVRNLSKSWKSEKNLDICASPCLSGLAQVSKVFVPSLLSPSFILPNHIPQFSTPVDNVSTPANAGSRHLQRLDEVGAHCSLPNSCLCEGPVLRLESRL